MQTIVRTRQGAVQGSAAQGVVAFKGIPYAAPPFGLHRFQPPQPVQAWEGVRPALTSGPTAPKAPYFPPLDALLPEVDIPGEDCLNLNIWSPDLGQARLPVMVWIHGGAFLNGSGSWPTSDGTRFARDGVVCVTLNYRLGADGFLCLGMALPTWACSTRWRRLAGYRRTSPASAEIPPTSRSLARRLAA